MYWVEYVGLFAGTCLAIANIPQLIRIIRTRDTKSISLLMYIIYCTGLASWLTYGILYKSLSMILSNAISLTIASIILVIKIINTVKSEDKV